MLKADSSTLKSESDVHSSAAPPTRPSAAALSCTVCTRLTIWSMGVPGSVFLISLTRNELSSARPVSPSSARDRNVNGTNESSAKYAIIAARCVPRSAKNFDQRSRLRTRIAPEPRLRRMDAQQALADLTEISSQIKAAVVLDGKGAVVGSTLPDGAALAQAATELLAAADELSPGASPLAQLEVATAEGSVFVVRQPGATIAATTAAG